MNKSLSREEIIVTELQCQLMLAELESKRGMLGELLEIIKKEDSSNFSLASQISLMDLEKLKSLDGDINSLMLEKLEDYSNHPKKIKGEAITQIQQAARLLIAELSIVIDKFKPIAEPEEID